jgi:HD-like signal output (HDOD) protein
MTHPHTNIINRQIESFPPLPRTATRVLSVTSDPKSNVKDLVQAILPDHTMCSVILKVANSAFFGIPRGVATIERAVVVLGYEEVRNIVIGKALLGSLPKFSKENRKTLEMFWQHAFTCGLAAKIVGEQLRILPSELFIAGLIHDIGKIAMLLAYPAEYPILRDISNSGGGHSTTEERIRFGIGHDEAGLRLARKWLLPEKLMMAIGFHHSPQDAPRCIEYPLIVQVADILSLMHSRSETVKAQDVEKMFNDLLPDIPAIWQSNNLSWEPQTLGSWYETLAQYHENEQEIFSIFTSR